MENKDFKEFKKTFKFLAGEADDKGSSWRKTKFIDGYYLADIALGIREFTDQFMRKVIKMEESEKKISKSLETLEGTVNDLVNAVRGYRERKSKK